MFVIKPPISTFIENAHSRSGFSQMMLNHWGSYLPYANLTLEKPSS